MTSRHKISISIRPEVHSAIRRACADRGISISDLLAEIITEKLQPTRRRKKKAPAPAIVRAIRPSVFLDPIVYRKAQRAAQKAGLHVPAMLASIVSERLLPVRLD